VDKRWLWKRHATVTEGEEENKGREERRWDTDMVEDLDHDSWQCSNVLKVERN